MDYKKLAADLLSGCDESCADCNYSTKEFECDISKLAAKAITELQRRAELLETANRILSVRITKEERKRVEAERERDTAIEQLNGHCDCCAFQKECKRSEPTVGCEHWKWIERCCVNN